MSVVGNLFDVAMVFAVALMVALVTRYNMTEMLSPEDFTMVKNPGKEDMEIIVKQGQNIDRYTPHPFRGPVQVRSERKAGRHSLRVGERRDHLCAGVACCGYAGTGKERLCRFQCRHSLSGFMVSLVNMCVSGWNCGGIRLREPLCSWPQSPHPCGRTPWLRHLSRCRS